MITKFVEKNSLKKMGVVQLVKKVHFYSEDEGSRFLQHVGNYLANYTASHPREEQSSVSEFREPKIS
jgi:hypothetical protein